MDVGTLRLPIASLKPHSPICVSMGTSVLEAVRRMNDQHIGCLCVVRDGVLQGIVTERDVLTKVVGRRRDPKGLKVEDIMTPDPEYLWEGDTVAFALNRMHVGGFRHVPLIDGAGRPTGIISVKDIVAHLTQWFEAGRK